MNYLESELRNMNNRMPLSINGMAMLRGNKFISCILGAILIIAVMTVSSAWSIVIRHDRADAQYRDIADQHLYGGIVNQSWGSATLISPTWIITAAHAVSSGNFYTPGGNFWNQGGTHNIVETVVHPKFNRNDHLTQGEGWKYDIALARLAEPVTDIEPVKLYCLNYGLEHQDPHNNQALILGFGNTGTGLTGAEEGTNGMGRGAETIITANASSWGWGEERLLTTFLHPDDGARDLHGGIAGGDSGGALLLNVNGEYALAGVNSQTWGSYEYGGGGLHVRTAIFNDWIMGYATDATIIPEPSIMTLFALVGLLLIKGRRL